MYSRELGVALYRRGRGARARVSPGTSDRGPGDGINHEEAREGDEGGNGRAAEVTETSRAQGQDKEEATTPLMLGRPQCTHGRATTSTDGGGDGPWRTATTRGTH